MWKKSKLLALTVGLMTILATSIASATVPVAIVTFKCESGKLIEAMFYSDKVELKLSDGRTLTVPQAMSASGARYANKDETFVFWNKGDTAFVTEGKDAKETYSGCVTMK
jgi:membrane-bound inhibitor of C-type lysozyme